ncbi:MAG: CCA tRNA nucleotidyltransferase [Ignavibacteriales bacterium]|nr:CCA tRNA nucleotidyltransferase [Ignavibacteriales bacterium]
MAIDTIDIAVPLLRSVGRIADELGIEAHVVGGYVRDKILGKDVNDIDIVVVGDGVAFAREVEERLHLEKMVTYENFGTAMLHQGDVKLEIVGARKESYSRDSRKPAVTVGTLADDLARRDFTVNAIAASLNADRWARLTDPYDGRSALEVGLIRTPLAPEKTFDDDPLRIMRAVRFAAQLEFMVDADALRAMEEMKERLSIISQERITDEFMKLLSCAAPSVGLKIMFNTGVMKIVFPEMVDLGGVEQRDDVHHKDVFLHTCTVIDNIARITENPYLRFAALVHDIAKPKTKQFREGTGWTFHGHEELGARMVKHLFRRMRLPLDQIPYVEKLVRLHLRPMALVDDGVTDSAVRRLLFEAGNEADDLMTLCRADITSKNPRLVKKYLTNYDLVYAKMREVEEKDRMRAFQSPVRGEEIMAVCALPPGKLVGVLKSKIEDAILDGVIPNEHDAALGYLLQIKDETIGDFRLHQG